MKNKRLILSVALFSLAAFAGNLVVAAELGRKQLTERWGIQAESLKISAAGFMVDFRYKVLDPEKAAKVVNSKNQPYIIDEHTGKRVVVPALVNVGSLRHTGRNLKKDKKYFVMFANDGNIVKSGSPVTVVMGDYKLEHVVVK